MGGEVASQRSAVAAIKSIVSLTSLFQDPNHLSHIVTNELV